MRISDWSSDVCSSDLRQGDRLSRAGRAARARRFRPLHRLQGAARYEAAMRSRTKLLTADQPADHVWLTALEAQMAEHGAALALARRDTVAALGEAPFGRASCRESVCP